MRVIVTMKDKRMYKGIKCGTEEGFVYLVNPHELTEDDRGELMPGDYMESPVGEEVYRRGLESVRIIQLPIVGIDIIESSSD